MKNKLLCFILTTILSVGILTSCTNDSKTTDTKPTPQNATELTTANTESTVADTTTATEITTIQNTTTATEPTTTKKENNTNSESQSKPSDKNSNTNKANDKNKPNKNNTSSNTTQSTSNKNNNNIISNAEVSGISLSKSTLDLKVGESKTLKLTFTPDNAYNKSYNVSTNNNKADIKCSGATITVYGIIAGKCTLTAKSYNGKTATCTINVKADPSTQTNIPENPYQAYAEEIVDLVNKERIKNGLSKVSLRNDITALANERAKELKTLYSHTRPDGTNITTKIINELIASSAAENIANGQTTPEQVMNDWMNSKVHRENILSPKYDGLGVGYYESNGICYWVQLFVG